MKNGELLSKAIVFATNSHAGQFDKGGYPYILHCLAVMNLLNFDGYNMSASDKEEIQCAAILHDVVEDTSATYADLKELGMTDNVIQFVKNVTKIPGETLEEYKLRVFSARGSVLIKEADLTHNSDIKRLKGISDKDIARMAKYHQFYMEIQKVKQSGITNDRRREFFIPYAKNT